MPPRIVTIGAYGFTEESFAQALQRAGVDVFVDIRQRRGVRGAQYAFVNKTRLEALLGRLGIQYKHAPQLAPTSEIRAIQHVVDEEGGVQKRQRAGLSPAFEAAYTKERLSSFDAQVFLRDIVGDGSVVALFCVEGNPDACHRSLVAERLRNDLRTEVLHLRP